MQRDDLESHPPISAADMVALWTVVFGEPPPLASDPVLMLHLVEAALVPAVRDQAETPTPIGHTTPVPPMPQ